MIANKFEKVRLYASKQPNNDRKAWDDIVGSFQEIVIFKWKQNDFAGYPEVDINNITILPNHFLNQLWRIPTVHPCNERRIMQIAFNAGRLGLPLDLYDFITYRSILIFVFTL